MGYLDKGKVPTYLLTSPYGELPVSIQELFYIVKIFNVDIYNAKLVHYTAHSYNNQIATLEIYDTDFIIRVTKKSSHNCKKSRRELLKYKIKNNNINETDLIMSYDFDIFCKDFFSIIDKRQGND